MTDDIRAKVVELLRETADKYQGIADAYSQMYGVQMSTDVDDNLRLRAQHPIWDYAVKARNDVHTAWYNLTGQWESYEENCHRAADLIKEGQWPR